MAAVMSFANGSIVNSTNCSSVLGLDEYGSDEELAAVELFKNYPEGLLKFATVCCALFMLIGIPGNIITIIALARCKKVRNATALFIINLSISDLLFCCFNLPLAGSTFWIEYWIHGRTLCRLFPMVRYALVAVSLFTILAITINRYIMISHPLLYPRLYTKRNLILMVAVIWIFSFGALVATWFEAWGRFSLEPSIGSCTIVPDQHGRSPKKILFIGAFLLPGLAIIICYARIFWIVKKVGKRSRPSLRLRPRPTTEIISSDSKSRDSVLDNRPTSINASQRIYSQRMNCLCSPTLENSSCSGAESCTQDDDDRKMPAGQRSVSSNETIRKIKFAFTNTTRTEPKPLLPTRKDKKLRTMIMAIMLAFCICHLPISVTKIFLEFTPHPVLKIISYILLYLTTCINPIIYVVMSNEYRQAYKNLVTCSPQVREMTEVTGMRIKNSFNKSFRRSEKKVKWKNTQEDV
ncbi:G-protein coupled receptor moody-like [Achroia grisella]|uniref:G-protein coupled receptor moody-like n=1 Tax=Achroia grisella TaxID=688607 RepID=UPI0027D2AAA5|nr:G-protein coupled receptor moody-like [Achroia grisella]